MSSIPPHPSEATLHEAALAYIARYAATQRGVLRVLDRRIDRWVRASAGADVAEAAQAAKRAARAVVARLVAAGLVDDAAYAAMRARSLTRAGRSRRAVAAHLAGKGIERAVAQDALPTDARLELAAAVALVRRRRLGAFRAEPADAEAHRKALGVLARAGFAQDVASRALRMTADEAEALIEALKRL
jgi:regulatory protein